MKLVVTEKDNAARRIAEILSGDTMRTERRRGVNVYRWGDTRVVGLSGHVVGVDFPPEYNDWRDVEPHELIRADIVTTPTQENIVTALRELARTCDEAIIATDYDREGELIGKEAYSIIRDETDVPIERVRFSSITENEVREAFANPDDLDFELAAAGEARQIIDLIWGAALTRFLSLSARQLGEDFISVGRVQSPTLKLIVDREREIEAFDPEDYWELVADLAKTDAGGEAFEAQYFYDDDGTEAERVWDEATAESVSETLQAADSATVTEVRRRTRTDSPPDPFNTTAFISAASSLGYSAQRAMSIAEDLYTAGYLTYPRTDNTVYPEDLDPEELLDAFVGSQEFSEDAAGLLTQDDIAPTRGDTETTDHPPIHPTGELPDRGELSADEWDVYELVVRRFFATVAEPATWEHLRVVADANGCALKANGKRLLEAGYHDVYPYASASETVVPDVEEGESLSISGVELLAKQTQPPRRYGQSRLIQRMEDLELGTKCLTADTQVLHRDDNDGDVRRRAVEALYEDGQGMLADGEADIAVAETAHTTFSFQESENRTVERQSTLISERDLGPEERVLDISTRSTSLSVTGDHLLYLCEDDRVTTKPAFSISAGDELLTVRRTFDREAEDAPTAVSWEEFAGRQDVASKLYGTGCAREIRGHRSDAGLTQCDVAAMIGTDQGAISDYENGNRDVPVWILDTLDIYPNSLHGLNEGTTFVNPFPVQWTPELARIMANLLGDGSIHVDEEENLVDVRYHNTDRRLVERFVSDIETVFDVTPHVGQQSGRERHHKRKYQVNLPNAIGRILVEVLEMVTEAGCPAVPARDIPSFIGALFDDEGHLSRDRKAFISNTDHDLLARVAEMLDDLGIDTKLAPGQHKLHIRGRENLERFLDSVPIAADEKFFRGLDALREYEVTVHKARLLDEIYETPKTTEELATELALSRGRVNDLLRELKATGYVEKQVEGSNRSQDGARTIEYAAIGFRESIYATLRGYPSTTEVLQVAERAYDGKVYDISVEEESPNFAVEGGVIVHNSTRHNIIEKLYDRGYLEDDPPRPTSLAAAVVEAAEQFADHVVSDEMTARLEADMAAIADGDATLDEVTEESREMLERVFEELRESREAIGDHLQDSLKADRRLGPCPDCGEDLLVRRSRQGSYFVGCDGFPDCRFTLPLPSTGEPLVLEKTCEEHDTNHVKLLAGRDTYVHGCPRCKADEAAETEDRVIGPCPECGPSHGGDLAIKQLRSGNRLVGCDRYPDCEYSLPLPRRGDIEVTETVCEDHDLPELVVHNGDDPWELGCPICNFHEYQAEQAVEDLEDLDGVGEATAEKLAAAGIEGLSDLAAADADEVATAVQGVSASQVREWQTELPG